MKPLTSRPAFLALDFCHMACAIMIIFKIGSKNYAVRLAGKEEKNHCGALTCSGAGVSTVNFSALSLAHLVGAKRLAAWRGYGMMRSRENQHLAFSTISLSTTKTPTITSTVACHV